MRVSWLISLTRRGHEVVLVSFGQMPDDRQTESLRGMRGIEYFPTAFRLEWMQGCREELDASNEFLLQLIAEKQPELLHFNQFCYGALDTPIPKLVVAHSDVWSWWVAVHGETPRERWTDEYRKVVAKGVKGADMVVGVTRWMLEQVDNYYARPKQQRIVHNGRSATRFEFAEGKRLGAITVGRIWDAGKQISLLRECADVLPITIAG